MYELIREGERTYFVDCPAKIGLWVADDGAWLIDSGSDKDAAKKALRHIESLGLPLRAVVNTHSHADHIGGNRLLQERTGCAVYAPGAEAALVRYPRLEATFLFGGAPCRELQSKFLLAPESRPLPLEKGTLPPGLDIVPLPGHSFDMIGLRTGDDVVFLADCVASEATLKKYAVSFLCDVDASLATLERIETMEARRFIPSHADPCDDIRPLARLNREKIEEFCALLVSLCWEPRGFEELLRLVFVHYGLSLDFTQYALVGSTVRTYLSHLHNRGMLAVRFDDGRLLWAAESTR